MFTTLALAAFLAAADGVEAPKAPTLPRMAVLKLEEDFGMPPGLTKVITELLVNEIRTTGTFSHVVSARELESLMGFEQQRQLLSCDSTSCISEAAGAMGVDLIFAGSLARVGGSYIMTARIIDVRTATPAAYGTRQGLKSDDALVAAVPEFIRDLLGQAKLLRDATSPVPAAPSSPALAANVAVQAQPAPATTAAPSAPPPKDDGGASPIKAPLLGVGGAGVAVGVVVAIVAGLALAGSGAGYLLPLFTHVPTDGLDGNQRYVALTVAPGVVAGGSVATGAVALVVALVGIAVLAGAAVAL